MANKKIKNDINLEEDNLYVSMYDAVNKRKNILNSIKNALIMQDEYEKVFEMRQNKKLILSEIKKEMSELNSNYQKLKKILPNVKNVLLHTEKELNELDSSIETLKSDIKSDKEIILTEERLINSINNKRIRKLNSKKEVKTEKKLTKIDRIKNNLKIIEAKLNSMN